MIPDFNEHGVCLNPITKVVQVDKYMYYAKVMVAEINGKWYRGGQMSYHNQGHGGPVMEKGSSYSSKEEAMKAEWQEHKESLERVVNLNDKEIKLYDLIIGKLNGQMELF